MGFIGRNLVNYLKTNPEIELYTPDIRTVDITKKNLGHVIYAIGDLNYDEAALLAALPKAPSKYNPYKSKKRATIRRNFVLKNLYENGYIKKKKIWRVKEEKN